MCRFLVALLLALFIPSSALAVVQYNTLDDQDHVTAALQPFSAPNGYLGVYHSQLANNDFSIFLGRSQDLLHWTEVTTLDPSGASMPRIQKVGKGYLLAYEKGQFPPQGDHIRLRYYSSLDQLEKGQYAKQLDLPRVFSDYNNGTPSFDSVPNINKIRLSFHYQSMVNGMPGPDREASGVVKNFRAFYPWRDQHIDALLSAAGMKGNHGDRSRIPCDNWRVYEAQSQPNDWGAWHIMFYDGHSMVPWKIDNQPASFGNPSFNLVGPYWVFTSFVFSAGPDQNHAGELIYRLPRSPCVEWQLLESNQGPSVLQTDTLPLS